jgi:ankyrin repeat protein
MLRILIRNGAKVSVSNQLGNTPLHYAIAYNFDKIAEVLIKNGANQLFRNNKGMTPWEGI